MEHIQWIFSGIGTQILSALGGLVLGGLIGYKIRDKQFGRQKQVGGEQSNQRQVFYVDTTNDALTDDSVTSHQKRQIINQSQKAGENSKQVQIGGIGGNNRR